MIEAGEDPCLGGQTGGQPETVPRGQHLDRHVAPQATVPAGKHHPERAGADLITQLVAGQRRGHLRTINDHGGACPRNDVD